MDLTKRSLLKILDLKNVGIFQQLLFEEVLLRNTSHNWFLYNSGGQEVPTIVLGFSGKVKELVNVEKALKDQIQAIRRFTGGGTVVIDHGTIFSSLILNSDDLSIQPYPREIMNWSESLFKGVFSQLDETEHRFSLRENDYILGSRKVGGNAQTITRKRFVHHTSFLSSFQPENMEYLLMPKKRPEYRLDRPHSSFLTTLQTHFPPTEGDDMFKEKLMSELREMKKIPTSSSSSSSSSSTEGVQFNCHLVSDSKIDMRLFQRSDQRREGKGDERDEGNVYKVMREIVLEALQTQTLREEEKKKDLRDRGESLENILMMDQKQRSEIDERKRAVERYFRSPLLKDRTFSIGKEQEELILQIISLKDVRTLPEDLEHYH